MEMSDDAMQLLQRYRWPGNVRELQNVVEQAMWFADREMIDVGHLPPAVRTRRRNAAAAARAPPADRRRALRRAGVGRLLVLGAHPPDLPVARHHAPRHPRAGRPRAAHDARQLPRAAAAVRDPDRGLQALPQLPDGARLQGRLPLVPPGHARAGAARRACCCRRSAAPAAEPTEAKLPSRLPHKPRFNNTSSPVFTVLFLYVRTPKLRPAPGTSQPIS